MKIVKAQMLGAPGGNRKFVGTDWIAIFKKDCDRDVRVFFRCVEDAAGLVTGHLGAGPWLCAGIYPSGIAHIVCLIDSIEITAHKQIGVRRENGLRDLFYAPGL